MPGVSEAELAEVAQLSSLADETPEGRSIVVLAKQYGIREHDMNTLHAEFVPFTAQTRMSGVDLDGQQPAQGRGRLGDRFVTERGRPPAGGAAGRRSTGSAARAARRWPSHGTPR